tara:strand:- start:91 stop:288 length:198 start_codon:yes stop_codon:yes gene_type:complete
MRLQKIKDEDGYQKDIDSGAVLSVDMNALTAYKARKNKDKIIVDEINEIKSDLSEIRDILRKLVK